MRLMLDSNVYLSFFLQDEKRSKESVRFMEWLKAHFSDYEVVVFQLVLIEVANVLMKAFDLSYAEVSTKYLASMVAQANGRVVEMHSGFENYLYDVYDHGVYLKTLDLLVYLASFNSGAELVTWDKRLVQQTNKIWRAKTPLDYL